MSQKIRRTLAVAAVLAVLSLTLPAPTQAAVLWDWQPEYVAAQVWSWLQDLGLVTRTPSMPSAPYDKEGSMLEPNGKPGSSSPPAPSGDEGSMLEPNG